LILHWQRIDALEYPNASSAKNTITSRGRAVLKRLVPTTLLFLFTSGVICGQVVRHENVSPGSDTIVVDGKKYPQTAHGVNSAIAAATGGLTVFIPNSFSVSETITLSRPGIRLSCGNGVRLTLADNTNKSILTISASRTRVTGCILDGNRSNQTAGFGIAIASAVKWVDLDHNQIENVFNDCIALNNVSYLRITQNRLSNCGRSGNTFAIDYLMQSLATTETDIIINENDIDQSESSSGGINLAANVANGVIQNFHVDGNTIKIGDAGTSVTMGIQAFSGALPGNIVSNGTVSLNEIYGPNITNRNAWGISVGLAGVVQGDVTVAGNTIRDTRGTCIEGISSGVTITGNDCDDTDGIQIPTNSAAIDAISVTGNTLTNGSGVNSAFLAQIGVSGSPKFRIRGAIVCNNSITNVPANRSAIFFNGNRTGQIADSLICNNIIIGRPTGMTKNAIEVGQSANVSIKGNNVMDWIGLGTAAIKIGAGNVTSTTLMENTFNNVTSSWTDRGAKTVIEDSFPIPFANLGSEANGSRVYCQNCVSANPCAPGGNGAYARRLENIWVCN
jgi:hypothetical protein